MAECIGVVSGQRSVDSLIEIRLVVAVTVMVSVLVTGILIVSLPLVVVIYVTNARLAKMMKMYSDTHRGALL